MVAFEIPNNLIILRPIVRLLRSVPAVSNVRRRWFKDGRIAFDFHGVPASVNEPWGYSSRYWIGLVDRIGYPDVDLVPLHEAFKSYRGFAAISFWPISRG